MIDISRFLVFLIIFSFLSSCQTMKKAEEQLNLSGLKIKNNFVNKIKKVSNSSKKNFNKNINDEEIKAIEQNIWDFSQMGEYEEAYKLAKKYENVDSALILNDLGTFYYNGWGIQKKL